MNKEKPYPTFFHILPASQIISVEVTGDITVRSVLAHISCLTADHCSSIFFMYLRAILCTFQISVDFYYVPVGGRGGGRGGAGRGGGIERG